MSDWGKNRPCSYQYCQPARAGVASQQEIGEKRMSSRKWIVQPVVCLGFAALAGCGGSDNSNQSIAPPSGAFDNSKLNGTYVFAFSGYDTRNGGGSFFAVVGSLTANGAGGFTSGTVDIVNPALGAWFGTDYVMSRGYLHHESGLGGAGARVLTRPRPPPRGWIRSDVMWHSPSCRRVCQTVASAVRARSARASHRERWQSIR